MHDSGWGDEGLDKSSLEEDIFVSFNRDPFIIMYRSIVLLHFCIHVNYRFDFLCKPTV